MLSSYWLLTDADTDQLSVKIICFGTIIFFGFGAILFALHLLRIIFRRPILIVNTDGIIDYTDFLEYGRFIKWSEVSDVRILTQRSNTGRQTQTHKYVCLHIKNPEEFAAKANWLQRHFMKINKNLTRSSDVYINCTFLAASPNEIEDDIYKMAEGKIVQAGNESVEITMDVSAAGISDMLLNGEAREVKYSDEHKQSEAEKSEQLKDS